MVIQFCNVLISIKKKIDNDVIKLALALVVGMTGIYCSYVISPYIAKGLNVVSEQVSEQIIDLPVLEEEGTTTVVFCFLTTVVLFNFVDVGLFISSLMTSNEIQNIAPVVHQLINIADDMSLSKQTVINDINMLNELRPVTNFLNDATKVAVISYCLIFKTFVSTLFFFDPIIFESLDEMHLDSCEILATLTNDELRAAAPYLREYYLSKQLGLNVDYQYLMQQCHTVNHLQTMLHFMEANFRFGSGLGGVSSYEIFLRIAHALQYYNLHPNLIEGRFLNVGNGIELYKQVFTQGIMDGSTAPYTCPPIGGYGITLNYGIDAINIYDIIKNIKI